MSAGTTRGSRFLVWMVLAVGLVFLLSGVSLGLPKSFKPDIRCPQGPTASKTQSKLWYNDGAWWGVLFNGTSEQYRIYRYDQAGDSWTDTGTVIDPRNTSRADVLWDEGHLYVVSAGTDVELEKDSARFSRYSYDPSTETYSLDDGYPVTITEGGMEAITVARDSTGTLWASYMKDLGDGLRRVQLIHTQDADDSRWVEPYAPPLRGVKGNDDDVATVVAMGSQVGLAWSNQYDEGGNAGFFFATHDDGAPDDSWQSDNPVQGPGWANDHLNVKTDSEGRVYMALKTRWDRIDRRPDRPFSMLWVRDPNGGWESHEFGKVRDAHTRSLVLLDEEQNTLYMFASAPTCTGGKVYYKRSSLDDISFEEGKGKLFMQSTDGTPIGDSSSTKQSIDANTDALVIASNKARDYYYNVVVPPGQEQMFPNGSPIDTDTTRRAETARASEGTR